MNWIKRLERPLGFLAIPNLIVAVIAGQAIMTFAGIQHPELPLLLQLDPIAVSHGQWYRLITWVIVPDTSRLGLIFAIFWFWFLWIIGRTLEQEWGAFPCTLYLLLGIALPSLGSMLLWYYFGISLVQTGLYFSLSLQLAFAAVAPEFMLYLFFFLPVKMRWLGWLIGAWLCFHALSGGAVGAVDVAFGVGNYLIFFLPQGIQAARQRRQVAVNRQVFTQARTEAEAIQFHRCHACGADRNADLRLCTCARCGEDGQFWCAEHLGPHLAALRPSAPVAKAPPPPEPDPPKKSGTAKRAKTKRKG